MVNFVLVHYGRSHFPSYIYDCIKQIRKTNPNSNIYLAMFKKVDAKVDFELLSKLNVILYDIKKNQWCLSHILFKLFNRGIFTTERFFILYEVMKKYHLTNVIHLENDNLIYADVNGIIKSLEDNYDLGIVRENDSRCIAGFFYVKNIKCLNKLLWFFIHNLKNINDMTHVSLFGYKYKLNYLPIYPLEYIENIGLREYESKKISNNSTLYCQNYSKIGFLFDGGVYGQYVGGGDIYVYPDIKPGFVNTTAYFDPNFINVKWDNSGEYPRPYLEYNNNAYYLVNLHVWSKELYKYM